MIESTNWAMRLGPLPKTSYLEVGTNGDALKTVTTISSAVEPISTGMWLKFRNMIGSVSVWF